MRILIFSHSAGIGGAEKALLNLINDLLAANHEIICVFPSPTGELIERLNKLGITTISKNIRNFLPDVSAGLMHVSETDLQPAIKYIHEHHVDLVITNTCVIFDGAISAAKAKIPHIWYIHELIDNSPELRPHGASYEMYIQWINQTSDSILCCSNAVLESLVKAKVTREKLRVIPPYRSGTDASSNVRKIASGDPLNLYVIGVHHQRKNGTFAVEVMKSLKMLGKNARLTFIGSQHSETRVIKRLIERRGIVDSVFFVDHVSDPYQFFSGKAINLICSVSEPFGLTVAECVERKIPVVASRCGGPEAYLPGEWLYDVDDIKGCLNAIEKIDHDYESSSETAGAVFDLYESDFSSAKLTDLLTAAVNHSVENFQEKILPRLFDRNVLNRVLNAEAISEDALVANIAKVVDKEAAEIQRIVADEKKQPGKSVMADCKEFNVIPFCYSKEMEDLYRNGTGFSIELAATARDNARKQMAAFTIGCLESLKEQLSSQKIKIAAVGDGIGIDSVRLAMLGYDIDYLDFERSVTSKVAEKNFAEYENHRDQSSGKVRIITRSELQENNYDAVMCFEVIEHVEDAFEFLKFLKALLKDDGLLFISECFECIKDIWPTHLSRNEKYAGTLPILASTLGLALQDYALLQFGKPYVFSRADKRTDANIINSNLLDHNMIKKFIISQASML